MSEQDVNPNKYNELRSIYKYYIDPYTELYRLKTEKEVNNVYTIPNVLFYKKYGSSYRKYNLPSNYV